MEPIEVSQEVKEQYEDIRSSGLVNMHDRNAVYALASERGHFNLALWVQINRYSYHRAVNYGMVSGLGE